MPSGSLWSVLWFAPADHLRCRYLFSTRLLHNILSKLCMELGLGWKRNYHSVNSSLEPWCALCTSVWRKHLVWSALPTSSIIDESVVNACHTQSRPTFHRKACFHSLAILLPVGFTAKHHKRIQKECWQHVSLMFLITHYPSLSRSLRLFAGWHHICDEDADPWVPWH